MRALVTGIIKRYEIDVDKIISKKIHNWMVSTYTTLAFPCLLTQICLNEGVPDISIIDQFFNSHEDDQLRFNWRLCKSYPEG